ncbi:hypothetical protein [Ancylobacter sp. SL191]|uniref:hypothetical protein n=1 Tax=Ancylobacter sp. SL191 TaxID=2995166 RepID=UPI00226E9975|nr:hypothetical protein [Ancylobacter sp. SL191]WAC27649.1 hypothetical protein OU996_00755 [Ancylobacter sp. SL191]
MKALRHLAALAAVAALPLVAVAPPALAQAGATTATPGTTPGPAAPAPGFSLQAVEGGVLKLDTRTGALSFCSAKAGAYVCEAVPEDRAALEAEISRLQARIAELEKGRAGVPDIMAPPAGKEGAPDAPMTEEARKRLDEALDVAEHAFRRFMDMVNRLRGEPAPQGEKL